MSSTFAGVQVPTTSFADLGLPGPILRVLAERGICHPLPIQEATIVDSLAGRDISGKAPTGCGKTLAFAIPLAMRVQRAKARRPRGLVLAPTRELAAQISKELAPLLGTRGLRCFPFYGGVGFAGQLQALRRGVDVAVACPGRLEDLMRSGELFLSETDLVVVDEADRMADMGFLPALRRILDATSAQRQTMLFSATLDGDVETLALHYQRHPLRHEAPAHADAKKAVHHFEAVEHAERMATCATLVAEEESSIIFVRTKHGADRLAHQLTRSGVAVAAIHGGRSQSQRERTLAEFRSGRVRALVATDVAARGIHVDAVSCVIHYDLPADSKDYIHRSGRTARAGATGRVVALVTPDKRAEAKVLARSLDIDVGGLIFKQAKSAAGSATGSAPASDTASSSGRVKAASSSGTRHPTPRSRPHAKPRSDRRSQAQRARSERRREKDHDCDPTFRYPCCQSSL